MFSKTIENKNNIINDELYYKYLKVIYVIVLLCDKRKISSENMEKIKGINDCMINFINKEELKNFIKENPKQLFIKKNNILLELNDNLIDDLLLNEILIFKVFDQEFNFDFKKYNNRVFNDLKSIITQKSWYYCNFQYINEYNFIFTDNKLKSEFKNFIRNILESPYLKNIYKEVESRFDNKTLFEDDFDKIYEEIFEHIYFFPFPIDDTYGYAFKRSFDIFITMYDINNESFDLLGRLYANCNDIIHEIYHISTCYYIINSEEKDFMNFKSRIPSKNKREYTQKQINFIDNIQSKDLRIKKEENIDLGDCIEIECYGFYIRDFTLKNVLELFLKENWYDPDKIKNFKKNFLESSKIEIKALNKEKKMKNP